MPGDSGFRELPIDFTHTIAAGRLPLIHRDPFDRMLVAQARCEDLILVTRNRTASNTRSTSCEPD